MYSKTKVFTAFMVLFQTFLFTSIHAQPVALRSDISIQKLITVRGGAFNGIRIAKNPATDELFYMTQNGSIYKIDLERKTDALIASSSDHGITDGEGFDVGSDGALYIVGIYDGSSGENNEAVIKKGILTGEGYEWHTLAQAEPYAVSGLRDHLFNAIAVDMENEYVYVNSGSRTDHGEKGTGGREFPITSAIFKLPAGGENIILENDEEALAPYLFADGVRNTFDLAFAPNGDLFGMENSDTRDNHEELNWIREGRHYGFPWRIGIYDNPQRFPDFDPASDLLLVPGINMEGTFHNDPDFPEPPENVVFTDPVLNAGPDGDKFRDPEDGKIKDASDLGEKIGTFTPHSTPLGLVFDADSALSGDLKGSAFGLLYNSSSREKFTPFGVDGESLLQIKLEKLTEEDRYEAAVTEVVTGFSGPVDAAMIGNKIYVIEVDGEAIWEMTFEQDQVTSVGGDREFTGPSVYPTVFRRGETVRLNFNTHREAAVKCIVYDIHGKTSLTLFKNELTGKAGNFEFNSAMLPETGVYILKILIGQENHYRKIVVL